MSIVQIEPAKDPVANPEIHAAQRTLQDELMTLARETARDCGAAVGRAAGKKPLPETLWATLHLIYAPRRTQLERALLVSERPSTTRFYTEALKMKALHDDKAKKLAGLTAKFKTPAPLTKADAAFQDYWKKIGAGNELEFVGALWMLETVLQAGHLLEEISSATRMLGWDGDDDDNMIAYLDDLVREFACLNGERILAGARHGTHYLKNLFAAWEK